LKFGTNLDYLTRRIARDHPDILQRMKAGEFKSVRAAEHINESSWCWPPLFPNPSIASRRYDLPANRDMQARFEAVPQNIWQLFGAENGLCCTAMGAPDFLSDG
jgi:hypothetical protein